MPCVGVPVPLCGSVCLPLVCLCRRRGFPSPVVVDEVVSDFPRSFSMYMGEHQAAQDALWVPKAATPHTGSTLALPASPWQGQVSLLRGPDLVSFATCALSIGGCPGAESRL